MNFQTTIILIPIALFIVLIVVKKCMYYFGRLISVKATLIDKYSDTYNSAVKFTGIQGQKTDYFLAFLVDNKKVVFSVSAIVYDSYEKGENGILTYKNSRLIKFE